MGNAIPLVGSVPLGVWAVLGMYRNGRIFGSELLWLGCMPAAAWLLMNFFGLFQNEAMRRDLARRMRLGPTGDPASRYFVGFARPAYRGLLDPHEDLGFLILHADRVEFKGELHDFSLKRSEMTQIRFRANPHSWVGLGRWISIEGVIEERPVRLLVEPRERPTLIGNLRLSSAIRSALVEWRTKSGLRTDGPEPAASSPKGTPA